MTAPLRSTRTHSYTQAPGRRTPALPARKSSPLRAPCQFPAAALPAAPESRAAQARPDAADGFLLAPLLFQAAPVIRSLVSALSSRASRLTRSTPPLSSRASRLTPSATPQRSSRAESSRFWRGRSRGIGSRLWRQQKRKAAPPSTAQIVCSQFSIQIPTLSPDSFRP